MECFPRRSRKSQSLDSVIVTPEDLDCIRRTPVDLGESPLMDKKASFSPISVAELSVADEFSVAGRHQKNSKFTRSLPTKPSFRLQDDDQPYQHVSTPLTSNKLKSRHAVVMGDTGAEVTFLERTPEETRQPLRTQRSYEEAISPLKEKLESISTPVARARSSDSAAEREDIPSVSLLDGDVCSNATNNHTSPPVTSFSACCTPQVVCCRPDAIIPATVSMQTVENRITVFLGSPIGVGDWCSGWQAWNYFESGPSVELQQSTKLKEDVKKVLRNRACNLKSKTHRMTKLKEQLNPFLATPKAKPEQLSRINSYQLDRTDLQHYDRTPKKSIVSMESVWESVTNCTAPSGKDVHSPFVIRTRGMCEPEEEDLCYDSDPEETTRRRSDWDRKTTFARPSGNSNLQQSRHGRYESRDIRERVQEFINQTFTLIWHPNTGGDYRKLGSPVAIKAWIERGNRLDRYGLLQPKLCWQKTANAAMATGTDPNEVFSCDILDITRILEVNRVDRRFYPFAQRRKSLLIQCMEDKMLFQAATEEDRDAMVHGLKLVVARLGSLIIVQNEDLFEEFFAFEESDVPGEAPTLG